MKRHPRKEDNSDRLPPHSIETEQAVLACVLIDPKCLDDCILKLKDGAKTFYDLRHQTIYSTFLELKDDGIGIDLVTLYERLSTWGKVEECGGMEYIQKLPDAAQSTSNLNNYLDVMLGKYAARNIITVCIDTIQQAYGVNGNGVAMLDEFEAQTMSIRNRLASGSVFVDVLGASRSLVNDYQAAESGQIAKGIPTGFRDIDYICGGMMEQDMIVIAGLQSTGKTTLAMNIAFNVAKTGNTVGIISLETSGKKLIHRLACYEGKVEGAPLLKGSASEASIVRISKAIGQIVALSPHLLICDNSGNDTKGLAAVSRRMVQRGAKMVVFDYLQLIEASGRGEFERVTKASRFIKAISKELNVPVIVVCALNREMTKGKKPRAPQISDLRMSGQIEYDADKVMLLYDPELRTEYDADEETRSVACRIAKQKDGPLGKVTLTFFVKQFRMVDAARIEEPQEPKRNEPEPPQTSLPYSDP